MGWFYYTLGSAIFQCTRSEDVYHNLFSVPVTGMVLLAACHEDRLPRQDGRAGDVSACLYLRRRPEDTADACLLNKAVMNKAWINPLFNLYQSAPSAWYQACQPCSQPSYTELL